MLRARETGLGVGWMGSGDVCDFTRTVLYQDMALGRKRGPRVKPRVLMLLGEMLVEGH